MRSVVTNYRKIVSHLILLASVPMAEPSQVEGRLRAILRGGVRGSVPRSVVTVAVLVTAAVLAPVALLQSAPVTGPVGAGVSAAVPSPDAASAKPATLYDTLPSSPQWTRQVSKSVGVELVGVTAGWDKTAQSWRPDRTLFAQPLYRRQDPQIQPQYPNKEVAREFALRLTHPVGLAIETEYQILGSNSFSYSSGPAYSNVVQITDEHEFSSETSGFRVVSAVLPKTLTRATVRVGVAAGPWREAASCGVEGNGSIGIANGDGSMDQVQFGKVFDSAGKHLLVVTDTYVKLDHRVIAVGTDGHVYDLHDRDIHNGQKFCVTTVKFDIPLNQIKEFRLQTRPYQWVEFKNVPLQPQASSPNR
jgi:hypothetical protein